MKLALLATIVMALGPIAAVAQTAPARPLAGTDILARVPFGTTAGTITQGNDPRVAGQRRSILEFGPACDGVTDDSPAVAAAATALRDTGAVIYIPANCRIRMGGAAQAWLRGAGIEGDGQRDLGPVMGQHGGTILLTDTARPPFVVTDGWSMRGLVFYWPNQALLTAGQQPIVYPPLVVPHSASERIMEWDFIGNQVVNAYDLIDVSAASAGHFHVERNAIYMLHYAFILQSVGGETWFDHNQFSPIAWNTAVLQGGVNPTFAWTSLNSEAIHIIGNGSPTQNSTTSVDGLGASENYFLLINSALHIAGGGAGLLTWTSNGMDGLPNPILINAYGSAEMQITGGQVLQTNPTNPTGQSGCAINVASGSDPTGPAAPNNSLSLTGVDFTGTAGSALCISDVGNARVSITGGSMWNTDSGGQAASTPAIYVNIPNGTLAAHGIALRNTVPANTGAGIYVQNARAVAITGNTFDGWKNAVVSIPAVPVTFTGNAVANTAGGPVVQGTASAFGNTSDIGIPQQLPPACAAAGVVAGQLCSNGSGAAAQIK